MSIMQTTMWTRAEVLALLQLITMVVIAIVHTLGNLILYQGKAPYLPWTPIAHD
jgi:hypothetical protein